MVVRRILATSGTFLPDRRRGWVAGPLVRAAIGMSRRPSGTRLAHLGTATGDRPDDAARVHEAFTGSDVRVQVVALLPMPNVEDLRETLLAQDVIHVGGGSVAGLLALWRLHGLDAVLREAWEAGIVLTGVSAGSICWHVGGPTDSFGPDLRVIDDGLALLPYGNGVHYDAEPTRRPLLQAAVADGRLPTSYATDDGVGLLYEDGELADVLADRDGASAYRVERVGDAAREIELSARRLTG